MGSFKTGFRSDENPIIQPCTTFNLPVYLDTQVLEYLAERAKAKGVPLNALVNQLLKKDIELIEAGR